MAKPIVVGVDVRDLRIATTGTKTYLEELCRAFRMMDDPGFRFVFFDIHSAAYTGKNYLYKFFEHIRFQFWKQVALPWKAWRNHCDIIFCTDYFVPLLQVGYKTVPVFHDAFFFEYPSHYNRLWLYLFRKLAVPAARHSPAVIVPSFYAKERVAYFTRIPPEKIHVVYEAPKKLPANGDPGRTDLMQRITRDKENGLRHILHVGSFDKRKNLGILIEALHRLVKEGHTGFRLILAGQASNKKFVDSSAQIFALVKQYSLEEYVIVPGYVSDQTLPWLYSQSFIYVYPSINEGFGIPVVEAFAMDLPVVVANNTCLPEVGGDAVIGFDPNDADALCDIIIKLAADPDLYANMVQKGKQRLAHFSWEKAARELTGIFRDSVSADR